MIMTTIEAVILAAVLILFGLAIGALLGAWFALRW
jgi:hypothetical protein